MQISTQNTLSLINIIIKSIFPDLAMHMQRTAYISLIIAKELNLHKNEIENIYIASNIHDIGFIDKNGRSQHPGISLRVNILLSMKRMV